VLKVQDTSSWRGTPLSPRITLPYLLLAPLPWLFRGSYIHTYMCARTRTLIPVSPPELLV